MPPLLSKYLTNSILPKTNKPGSVNLMEWFQVKDPNFFTSSSNKLLSIKATFFTLLL